MILVRDASWIRKRPRSEMVSFSDYGDTMVSLEDSTGVGYRGRVCQEHPLSVGVG